MIATPGPIEQLATDAVTASDPDSAMRALSALRYELDQPDSPPPCGLEEL